MEDQNQPPAYDGVLTGFGAVAACMLLGAFGGCDVGAVGMLHELPLDMGATTVIGIAAGTVAGFVYRARTAGSETGAIQQQTSPRITLGVLCLLLSLVWARIAWLSVMLCAAAMSSRRNPNVPGNAPLVPMVSV